MIQIRKLIDTFFKFKKHDMILTLTVCLIMFFFFSFKILARLLEAPFLVIILLSSLISYIVAKARPCIKCKDRVPS